MIYGIQGTWNIIGGDPHAGGPAAAMALVLVLAGLGFKMGLVPFHMWMPDVLAGSPAPVASFIATGSKVAVFAFAGRVLTSTLGDFSPVWFGVLTVMAVASMLWGNLAALVQSDLKRLMAYSGIAHAGYLGVALLAADRLPEESLAALGFYLFAYVFLTAGCFTLFAALETPGERLGQERLAGIGRRHPVVGAAMALFLFGLAGLPPTSGFMAKFWVFLAAVHADMTWLAVLGVIASAIGAVYYLRLVRIIFMDQPSGSPPQVSMGIGVLAIFLAALATIWLGVMPGRFLEFIRYTTHP
jgi:NADH-quinone oxidoreductase subunit N